MNEEGRTIANQSQKVAAREPSTVGIVRRWWLLAAVTVVQLGAAAALRLVPLARLRFEATRCRRMARLFVADSNASVAWALEATGRRLGRFSSCLARAVAAEMLFDAADGPT